MGKKISGIILISIISTIFIGGCGKKEEPKESLTKAEYSEEKVTEILKETEDLLTGKKEEEEKPKENKEEDKKDKEIENDPLAMEDKVPFEKKKGFLEKFDKLYDKYMNNDRKELEKVKAEYEEWQKFLNEILDYLYKDSDKVAAIKRDQDLWRKEMQKIEGKEKAKELDKYKELLPNYQERTKILISNYVE